MAAAPINIEGRFEEWNRESSDDGWFQDPPEEPLRLKTTIHIEHAKSVISRHNSPDVGFSQSINPYRGCSHGCSYCSSPDTPVLLANGRTLPISELRVGDEIIRDEIGHQLPAIHKGARTRPPGASSSRLTEQLSRMGPIHLTMPITRFLSDRGYGSTSRVLNKVPAGGRPDN